MSFEQGGTRRSSQMRVFTFSSYINARTIYEGAEKLGAEVFTTDASPRFPIPVGRPASPDDRLLFTEEDSLRRALNGELTGRFYPPTFPLDLLDDKWAFAEWLCARRDLTQALMQWLPDQVEAASLPLVVKPKHSWVDGERMPRGWVCRSSEDAERALERIGRRRDEFMLQEWLGDDETCRVISVCGFHDYERPERNLTAVVERVAAHRGDVGTSAAVRTIRDEFDLRRRATAILDALGFSGPFELEFLVTATRVATLELNPRLWMQHGIFVPFGNGVLRRCLDLDTADDRDETVPVGVLWLDGVHLVRALSRGDARLLRVALSGRRHGRNRVVICPPVGAVARLAARQLRFRRPFRR